MNVLLPLFIVIPLLAAFLTIPAGRLSRRLPEIMANLTALSLFVISIAALLSRPLNQTLVFKLGGIAPPYGICLVLDGLSQLMLLTISLVMMIGCFYSISYMEKYTAKGRFFTLLMLMYAGMNGCVLSGDLFNLFIFLELAAISTYALVAFGGEDEELEAAFRYLIIGTVASLFLLFAIALCYSLTGTLFMAQMALALPPVYRSLKALLLTLFILGFGMKAALIPFHAWLPDAHTSAPAPISATLSGVLIKALGIYCLIRVFYNVMGMSAELSYVLLVLGAVSILAGGILALGQWDIKRLLAYSSISQMGYIVLGIGLATPLGILGALFHVFNHALFKPLLFLNAGAIEYSAGTRDMRKMGGLFGKLPVTSATSLVGSFAISGLPPFNGFWSKFFIILACVQVGRIWFALFAVIGSILTLAYFMKLQRYTFFERLPESLQTVKEAPLTMLIPMITLALACFVIGIVFPYLVQFLINPAVASVVNGKRYALTVLGGL